MAKYIPVDPEAIVYEDNESPKALKLFSQAELKAIHEDGQHHLVKIAGKDEDETEETETVAKPAPKKGK